MFRGSTRGMVGAVVLCAGLAGMTGWGPKPTRAGPGNAQGGGIVIELDEAFVTKHQNLVMSESEFTVVKLSSVHPPANDGEVHVGGWANEPGLACVAEVMNAATTGKMAKAAFAGAVGGNKKVTVTGAWRIWCEHGGTTAQLSAAGPKPEGELPGAAPSNPDHVYEIHPVLSVKVGDTVTSAAAAVGATPGFTPHDASKAFLQGYEKLASKIVRRPENRIRIITEAAQFNFTQFVFQLDENIVPLADGHAAIGSIHDTDGELLVRSRRVVFMKGTAADDVVKGGKKRDRFQIIGIPRLSLKLLKYRLDHEAELKEAHGTSPLEWRLPYEMIAVSAVPVAGGDDE